MGWSSRPRPRRARRHHYAVRYAFHDELELPTTNGALAASRTFSTRSRRPCLSSSGGPEKLVAAIGQGLCQRG